MRRRRRRRKKRRYSGHVRVFGVIGEDLEGVVVIVDISRIDLHELGDFRKDISDLGAVSIPMHKDQEEEEGGGEGGRRRRRKRRRKRRKANQRDMRVRIWPSIILLKP